MEPLPLVLVVLDQTEGQFINTSLVLQLLFASRATPIRPRSDIGARQRVREINLAGSESNVR